MKNESDVVDDSIIDADTTEQYVVDENLYYPTGKVSELLHISRDMARKHIKDFVEFLNVTYSNDSGKGSHIKLCSSDLKKLETIIELRKTHSIEETKQILSNPATEIVTLGDLDIKKILFEILASNNEYYLSCLTSTLSDFENDFFEKQAEIMKEQSELMKEQSEIIKRQSEQIEQQNELINELLRKKKSKFSFFKKD